MDIKGSAAGIINFVNQVIQEVAAVVSDVVGVAFGAISEGLEDQLDQAAELSQQRIEALKEQQSGYQDFLDQQLQRELERLGLAEETKQEAFESDVERFNKLLQGTGLTYQQLRGLDQQRQNEILSEIDSSEQAKNAQAELEKVRESDRANVEADFQAQKLASEKDYNAQIEAEEQRAAREQALIAYRIELNNWRAQIAQSIINTIASSKRFHFHQRRRRWVPPLRLLRRGLELHKQPYLKKINHSSRALMLGHLMFLVIPWPRYTRAK
jgi:predicted ribosome quality control (RQC) complex YloA/Tae2 family protein